MRGQPGRGGGRARPRAGAMLSHSLWCRAGSPGDWTPQAPLFANLTQTDPLQVEWAGAVGGPPTSLLSAAEGRGCPSKGSPGFPATLFSGLLGGRESRARGSGRS